MGVFKRKIALRNLHLVDVLVEDTNNDYFQVLEAPDVLPQGKISALIAGSQFLKRETDVLVEMITTPDDSADIQSVFANPVRGYLEGNARRISFEIYPEDHVVPDQMTVFLTILGEIDGGKVNFNIPERYRDVYNVRFQKTFNVNLNIPNTAPIIFLSHPKIYVNETIIPEIRPSEGIFDVPKIWTGSLAGERDPAFKPYIVNPAAIRPVSADIETKIGPFSALVISSRECSSEWMITKIRTSTFC